MIRVETSRPGIWLATLDRPERLNALTFDMFDELARLCDRVDADDAVRVLVVTGAGRGFCAGLDLDDADTLGAMSAEEMLQGQEGWAAAIARFRYVRTPVVAAVNGSAAGAGLALALAADIRLAGDTAQFNAAFVRIGLTGGDCGTSWLLPRIVGFGHASELLLTGRVVDAVEAHRIGLVNRVVADDELMGTALELAEEITRNSPLGVRLTKQVLQHNVDAPSLEAAIELENRNQVLATRTPDMAEALAAFREKRAARFGGGDPGSRARAMVEAYFGALKRADFEAAVDCFTDDVSYSHPPYPWEGTGAAWHEVHGREELLELLRWRGPRPGSARIDTFLADAGRLMFGGVVHDEDGSPVARFASSGRFETSTGRLSEYVSFLGAAADPASR